MSAVDGFQEKTEQQTLEQKAKLIRSRYPNRNLSTLIQFFKEMVKKEAAFIVSDFQLI